MTVTRQSDDMGTVVVVATLFVSNESEKTEAEFSGHGYYSSNEKNFTAHFHATKKVRIGDTAAYQGTLYRIKGMQDPTGDRRYMSIKCEELPNQGGDDDNG